MPGAPVASAKNSHFVMGLTKGPPLNRTSSLQIQRKERTFVDVSKQKIHLSVMALIWPSL